MTPRQPKLFSVMITSASAMAISGATSGSRGGLCMTSRHMGEGGAEQAARMEGPELRGVEALVLEQRHRERIADGELQQGRGRRRHADRAGFAGIGQAERDIGLIGERAVGTARHGDELHAKRLA